MQKQVTDAFVFLSVPAELLKETGINVVLPLQYYVSGRKLIVENVEEVGDIVCNEDCDRCPMSETKHDNTGKCKRMRDCKGREVDWAEKQSGGIVMQ